MLSAQGLNANPTASKKLAAIVSGSQPCSRVCVCVCVNFALVCTDVMAPYKMVKDTRSQHETSQIQNVLDGELEPFMQAYLRYSAAEAEAAKKAENS